MKKVKKVLVYVIVLVAIVVVLRMCNSSGFKSIFQTDSPQAEW